MSIRIEYGGVTYFCESPEEAVALGRLLAPVNGRSRLQPETSTGSTNGNGACVAELVRTLKEGPKRLLRAVVEAPNGEIRSSDLLEELAIDPSAFGGQLAAITKAAGRANVNQKTFFQRVSRETQDGKYDIFKVPSSAREQVLAGLGD